MIHQLHKKFYIVTHDFMGEMRLFRFCENLRSNRNKLTHIDRLHEVLQTFRKSYNLDTSIVVDVVIGLDACSFDRITAIGHKYLFCFYMQPISPEFKFIPIHLISAENCKADDSIIKLRDNITKNTNREWL